VVSIFLKDFPERNLNIIFLDLKAIEIAKQCKRLAGTVLAARGARLVMVGHG
jgi:hypothetical protein